MDKYVFRDWDPIFLTLFENEKKRLQKFLPRECQIEHIGSTSVPGLGGKGIIDIYVVVSVNQIYTTFCQIIKAGWVFDPGTGIDWGFFFNNKLPDPIEGKRHYHLHLSHKGHANFASCIKFREYLKTHPVDLKRYADAKREGARKANNVRQKYVETKERVIQEILVNIKNKALVTKVRTTANKPPNQPKR